MQKRKGESGTERRGEKKAKKDEKAEEKTKSHR